MNTTPARRRLSTHLGRPAVVLLLLAGGLSLGGPRPAAPAAAAAAAGAVVPRLVVQMGNLGEVGLVGLSPDGRLALTASADGSSKDHVICLWEAATGREIRRLAGHTERLRAVTFSPDGRLAASASDDRTARVWDLETGAEVRRFEHAQWVTAVSFAPDGRHLLSATTADYAGKGASGHIWEVATGSRVRTLDGHTREVTAAVYSEGGGLIATGSTDTSVRLWDAADGRLLRELKESTSPVLALAFSRDGNLLAVGEGDKTARLYDARSGAAVKKFACPSAVTSVGLTPDHKLLLTAGGQFRDKKIRLWGVETGKEERQLAGAEQAVFSADGRQVLAASPGGTEHSAGLWDVGTGKLIRRFQSFVQAVSQAEVSPDGDHLVAVSALGEGRLWNVRAGLSQPVTEGFAEDNWRSLSINVAAFDGAGHLMTAEEDSVLTRGVGGVQLWDLKTGRKTRRVQTGGAGALAVSADGQWFTVGRGGVFAQHTKDFTARLYHAPTGKEARKFGDHTSTVAGVALSADGQFLLTMPESIGSATDDAPRLWDAGSGRELRRFASPKTRGARADAVALSPDARWAATANVTYEDDPVVLLWDARSGAELFTLRSEGAAKGFAGQVNALAFSADGTRLATASNDRTIRLWDVATGRELKRLAGHAGAVASVRFAFGDRHLLSAGRDGTVRLWSVEDGRELCQLISLARGDGPAGGRDAWVVVAPDGRFDTNSLDRIEGLHWVLPDSPFRPLPLEIFSRDYFEPQLLPRLLRCEAERNCGQEFAPVRDLSALNRAQPEVKITRVTPPDKERVVQVTVEVGPGSFEFSRGGAPVRQTSAAYDLRLFRNGQLVGSTAAGERPAAGAPDELTRWRAATEVRPGPDGRRSFVFPVRVPFHLDYNQSVTLSAYAFNEDRVKSDTARWEKAEANAAALSEAPPSRRAYIISVGVNASRVERLRLRYAANDARLLQRALAERLSQTSQTVVDERMYNDPDARRYARQLNYYEVVAVPLIADDVTQPDGTTAAVRDATKARIKAALDLLAGREVDAALRSGPPNFEQLRKATPDDLVLITFSSHGYADAAGVFYLLPYDVEAGAGGSVDLRSAVSSEELSLWLRDVDAGEMALVIDACHAAALAGPSFRPGPFGSRGLGQLGYDKGMRILAATQADNVALELDRLEQGLLSYALVRDGLGGEAAAALAPDRPLTLGAWLKYGARRVPELYEEVRAGKRELRVDSRQADERARAELVGAARQQNLQQPVLFDFAGTAKSSRLAAPARK